MSRILLRHLVADLLRVLILTASVLVAVIAFGAAIRPIMQSLLGAADLPEFVTLASIPMLQFALPLSAAFAGTIVYARLAADNEVLAMSAAGLSYGRILLPAAALGGALLVAMAVLVDVAVPPSWSSMQRLITKDPTRLFTAAVAKGEALVVPGSGTQIYADEARIVEVPAAPGAPVTRLVLAGVAALEMGDDGRPETEFTAEFATVDVYRENDSAYVKLRLRNATAFRDGEDALVFVPEAEPEAIDLGKGIRLKPKDLPLAGLVAIWNDVDRYHEVADARAASIAALAHLDLWRAIGRVLGEDGSLRLADAGGRRTYEIRNARLEGDRLLPRDGRAVTLVELERGIASRRAEVPEARLVAESSARDGVRRFELLARAETVADLRGVGGGGRWPPRIVGLLPERMDVADRSARSTAEIVAEAEAQADTQANVESDSIATAPLAAVDAAAAAAAAAGARLGEAEARVRAEIVARIVQRINQSLSAPLMLLLGAILAIRLRGRNPLAIYLLAFLPSIANMLLISGGEQMLKEATSAGGVLVASSGNLLLVLGIADSWRRIARN